MSLNLILIILSIIGIIIFFVIKDKKIKLLLGIITSICIILSCCFSFMPLLDKINYGLDLQGGFEVLYEVSPLQDGEKLDSDVQK